MSLGHALGVYVAGRILAIVAVVALVAALLGGGAVWLFTRDPGWGYYRIEGAVLQPSSEADANMRCKKAGTAHGHKRTTCRLYDAPQEAPER